MIKASSGQKCTIAHSKAFFVHSFYVLHCRYVNSHVSYKGGDKEVEENTNSGHNRSQNVQNIQDSYDIIYRI